MEARNALAQEAVVHEALGQTETKTDTVASQAFSDDMYDASAMIDFAGRGYILSNGAEIHSAVGLEGGVDSNVFYQASSENPVGAALLRQTAFVTVANERLTADSTDDSEPAVEITPRRFEYQAGVRASYQEFLNSADDVQDQRRLNVAAFAEAVAHSQSNFTLVLRDRFIREGQSPSFETDQVFNRDDNKLWVGVRYAPVGHTFTDTVHYENWFSAFENTPLFQPRMNHTIGLLHWWNVTSSTSVAGDVTYGFFGPFGDANSMLTPYVKTSSQPFRAVVSAQHLVTSRVTLKAHAGYSHASYDVGPGYSTPVAGASADYRWSETGALTALYDYDHYDSFIANFYRDHLFALKFAQQINWIVLDGGPEVRVRRYEGIPAAIGPSSRNDVDTSIRARVQALLNNRYALSLEYRLAAVATDYRPLSMDDPSWTRHQVTLGLWAAY
ncbi:MAG TPA: hypothetical protein VMJ10_17275 [Kofleriaceae bacterium]|nr:hypothetical protein [Kofleriaceae bacterium]